MDDGDEDPDLMEQVFNTDSSIQKIGYIYSNVLFSQPDQLYAITYTNGLFVWDLNTHDLIYKTNANSDDEEDDYFFDCFYFKSKPDELPLLTSCTTDKRGRIRLVQEKQILSEVSKQTNPNEDNKLNERTHRDLIRDSYWNSVACNFYTAGEDGFLIKWKLTEKYSVTNSDEKRATHKRERIDEGESVYDESFNERLDFRNKKKFLNK